VRRRPIQYRPLMRLLVATVLLLIQLRPLAAGVICFERTLLSDDCAMPASSTGVSQPDEAPPSPVTCPEAVLCSATAPAVPVPLVSFSTSVASVLPQTVAPAETPRGPALSPPFHPPRI
jgi:hypothetical protein